KSFGTNEALKGISNKVDEQEVVCIMGASGSGQSTFLRCLNLLEEVTAGHILIDGEDLTDPKVNINQLRSQIGMVCQHSNLFPHKTVLENITLGLIKVRTDSKADAEKHQ